MIARTRQLSAMHTWCALIVDHHSHQLAWRTCLAGWTPARGLAG
jgi:hypothetical protein